MKFWSSCHIAQKSKKIKSARPHMSAAIQSRGRFGSHLGREGCREAPPGHGENSPGIARAWGRPEKATGGSPSSGISENCKCYCSNGDLQLPTSAPPPLPGHVRAHAALLPPWAGTHTYWSLTHPSPQHPLAQPVSHAWETTTNCQPPCSEVLPLQPAIHRAVAVLSSPVPHRASLPVPCSSPAPWGSHRVPSATANLLQPPAGKG
jgi:hypothetical protein